MKNLLLLAVAVLFCGCHAAYHGHRRSVELGFGINPPTNAVVGVSFTSIGIIVGQNAATQMPEFTIGYKRGSYHRVPIVDSNFYVVPIQSGIVTTREDFHTTVREEFSTGLTNSILK